MTTLAWSALAVAAMAAVADWFAVGTERRRLEYVAKPLTMTALVVVAAALDPGDDARRAWFVAAGILSLSGDVFLMLPRDRFVPGLVSFLLAHICYVAGLLQLPLDPTGLVIGVVVVALALATIGRREVAAVRARHRGLVGPVVAYMLVISAMVGAAFATGPVLAIVGAVLFYISDSLIAERRFVRPTAWMPVAIMVTYHLGQAGLVLSLAV